LGNNVATQLSISAVGNSSYTQSTAQQVYLGNVAISGGTFSVDASGSLGTKISQWGSTSIKSFGNPTFLTQGGSVTLANSGNNFGGVSISTNVGAAAGADIAVTETGVLNFLTVNSGTAGKLTAISENASIIQSGTTGLTIGGTASFAAQNGNIALNTPTTNNMFGGNNGILLTSNGNVSVQDASAITALAGGTNVAGTLSVKNSLLAGTGEIRDLPGTVTVSGNVLFETGSNASSRINLGTSNLSLGAIQFRSGTVTIVENATLNLAAGSVATGAVSLTSSGNIVTSGSGGGTFQNTLALNASGSITITNPIFVSGSGSSGLTFRALGAVDLSALSLAGNLNGIAPTNLGASSYKAPSP
jgi:hypothetical protein